MRVVPRIIRNIRPGMQKCVPGLFAYKQRRMLYGMYVMLAYKYILYSIRRATRTRNTKYSESAYVYKTKKGMN